MAARQGTKGANILFLTFILLLIPACATVGSERTLEEIKTQLECVTYVQELPWDQVKGSFGGVDEAPRPAPGSLFKNVRIYRDKIVIFHVDTKETEEAGRPKFIEVVKSIEICKEK